MTHEFLNEDAIEILSFGPKASKRKLVGYTFSIWNTSTKSCGMTFSSEFFEKYEERGFRYLSVAVNKITGEVYFIFDKKGDITLSPTGQKEGTKNYTVLRRDVVNKLAPLLKLDFTDPEKKQHALFYMERSATTTSEVWIVKGKVEA